MQAVDTRPAAPPRDVQIDRTQAIAPQIYAVLRQRIVDNRLGPEEQLSESALAKTFDISRTPLRAALQQLAREGLIDILPQVGSVVAKLDTARLEEAVFMRAALEEAVARRLASRPFDRDRLVASFAAQEVAAKADNYEVFFREDERFHALLAELAGVPNAWKMVHSIKGHVDRQRYKMMSGIPYRSMRAYREHQEVVRRIVAGDSEGAARAMRVHVNSVLELTPPEVKDGEPQQA